MPLAFDSTSHGEIAFGFFNIDGDMLLLERTFFFADTFASAVEGLAADRAVMSIPGYVIERAADVGDLMGAIHGVRHTGFIGDVYRRFPFPARPEDFRQKTRGHETRDEFRALIAPWAREEEVKMAARPDAGEISLGGVRFTREGFFELVRYVWRGGWPRWENDEPPGYVVAMRAAILGGSGWATRGLVLRD